jgi:hypothetical protein
MSIESAHTYDLSEIYEWVEQRNKFYTDEKEMAWRIMRFQTTNILNMVAKKPLKETDLFRIGSEMDAKPKISMEEARDRFAQWDKQKENG